MPKSSGYGKPTYAKAVAARLGFGDGYGRAPKVKAGPLSPFGPGMTAQDLLDARERQSTDSNNR